MQLAVLQLYSGLARVTSYRDHWAVAARTPLWLVPVSMVRLICWSAHPGAINLDLAGRGNMVDHSLPCHDEVAAPR